MKTERRLLSHMFGEVDGKWKFLPLAMLTVVMIFSLLLLFRIQTDGNLSAYGNYCFLRRGVVYLSGPILISIVVISKVCHWVPGLLLFLTFEHVYKVASALYTGKDWGGSLLIALLMLSTIVYLFAKLRKIALTEIRSVDKSWMSPFLLDNQDRQEGN